MNQWKYVKLGEVCTIERGGSPRPIDDFITTDENGINWIKIGDADESMYITKTAQRIKPEGMKKSRYVKPGDFLLSNSMSFGRPYILKIDGCIHDGWLVLRDENNVFDKKFLYYYLSAPITYKRFKSMAVGGVVNNLNSDMVRKVRVPIPSQEEQHQISDRLDKVSNLIFLRKQQLAKLDELVKARFVEMFGEPVQNPNCWKTENLLDLGYCKNGMNFHRDDYGTEIHCLGVGDFKNHSTIRDVGSLPFISLNELPTSEYLLQDGDIVFVRSNGNKELVGRCLAIYPAKIPVTYSGFCIRYRLTSNKITVSYLLRVLKADSVRKKMTGRGANIQNLNQQILAQLVVPIPPLSLQNQFAAFVERVDQQKQTVQQSLEKLELMKKALMQEYFG